MSRNTPKDFKAVVESFYINDDLLELILLKKPYNFHSNYINDSLCGTYTSEMKVK